MTYPSCQSGTALHRLKQQFTRTRYCRDGWAFALGCRRKHRIASYKKTYTLNPDSAGLLVNGHVFPNPLSYARKAELWGKARPIDIATGFIHGDLNANNILVKFSENNEFLDGYYLIDFALFKDQMPLFYDQRYLEMSYLMHAMSRISFAKCVDFLTLLAVADVPDPHKVPIEMSGVIFGHWVCSKRIWWVGARQSSEFA